MPIVIEVPNRGRIELPDGTPEAEIDSIVSKEFPPTGEDIAQRLAEDPTFRLDDQQFAEFEKYSKAKQTDWVNAIASGVDLLVQTATTAAVEGVKGAALNPANYLEGFGQGTRQLYGFAAQSQDPGSPMFRFKDLIAGTGTLQSRREQFNQARDFNEQSIKYESGQETMLPKELVNPEFAQGVSLVADPTMLIPGLGQVFGAEKLVAKAIGKGAQVAGRTIKGPAGLINRAVSVAESALTQTAGMSPEAFRAGLSTTGVLGVAGVADPTAGLIASVPVAARTAAGFGAGLEEVGTSLLRAPSRIGALESLGMTPDASLARRAIGFAGRFGGDTALNTGIAATAGAAEGALVGGGMGYLSGGEEGAAVGIGSGLAAGAPGAVLGRVYQGMTGQLARDARVNDLARYVSTLSDNKRSVYESVQKRFGTDVAANLMDLEALVRGKRNDISVDLLNESDFKTATGGIVARGIVPDENSPTPRILVNVDALSKGTGDNPIYTLGHELVHALGTSKQFQGDLAGITERLTGTYVPNPDGTFKLVEAGQYTPAKVEELFNQYLSKLPEGVRQQVLTDNPTAADRANYVGEELVAEQVGRILSSQKPDAFLRNFGTLKSDFTDWLIVKEAYEKVSKVGQWIESKFGVKPSDSILFPQIKETSPVLNATLRQLLRARTNLDEAINRADFRKTFSINAKNISDPTVADLAIKGGFAVRNADGTVRLLTNGELLQRDTQDVILARETLGRVPGAKMDINGSLDKAPTPEQVAAINASTGISSHMKERFAMASQSIADGRSIFGEYYPATERVKDTSSNRWRVKYAPRKVTLRDTLPYNLLFSKENNAYIRGIDITKIRSEIQKHVRAGGVAGLWPDVGAFMSDLAAYFTNRDRGEAGLPTRELLGPDKAKFMGDFLNRFEKGGSEFVHSFRLDRFGEMRPGDFRARFSETGYKGMKDRLMPAGQVGDTESFKSESGYTVLSKNNKFRLYGPGGELLGIYDSPQQAERKINATETRLQSKIDQQQRPQGNEGRQTAEAGGGNRPERGPQGGEEGGQALGQVRQEGDVSFMSEGEARPSAEYSKEEKKALGEARKRVSKNRQQYPEAVPLAMQVDSKTGKVKFDQLTNPDGSSVLDSKGKPVFDVVFKQVPYDLINAPKLSKDKVKARAQAADLLEADARKAINVPSIQNGIGWYSRMRNFLQDAFGSSIELFGQLLGATSARTPVDTNFKQALEAIRIYSSGKYDQLLSDFDAHVRKAKADAESGALFNAWKERNPGKRDSLFKVQDELRKEINRFDGIPLRENGKKFNANSQKVLHVLYGLWLDQTVGPKTPNFAGNLTGRTLKATIDVWAARNLRRLLYEGKTERWRILPEQETGVSEPDFYFAQDVYDDVGKRLNMNPDDLQALMWFMEKDVWEKNGWTSTVGAEKSSFDKEAGKLALDRYQAGVTTFTTPEKFDPKVQDQERMAIRNSIAKLPGMVSSRVTHSDGLYGNTVEPSFDVEFSVQRNSDGTSPDIRPQIAEIIRVASEQDRKQNDVFVSKIVDSKHPNARPIVEVGFKKSASPEDVQNVTQVFQSNGIDGFTLAKDQRGNVIGIRAQYIPEISARFDTLDHLDPVKNIALANEWMQKAETSLAALDAIENVSYKKPGHVSTTVYGIEEYGKAAPQDLSRASLVEELGRRKRVLESGSISSGPASDEGMVSGGGGLPVARGNVSAEDLPAGSAAVDPRFMPSDTDYLAAVKAGDTQAAQQMVDQAAKAAGYADEYFRVIPEGATITQEKYSSGAYIPTYLSKTPWEPFSGQEGYKTVKVWVKKGRQGVVADEDLRFGDPRFMQYTQSRFDSVTSDDPSNDTLVVFNVRNIKSADPITRDNSGNVIPLSQRFQKSSADIRFMPQPDPSVPGAYSVTGGFRILPGKTAGRLRVYGPSGALVGIAGSLDEAQRMIRKKNRF